MAPDIATRFSFQHPKKQQQAWVEVAGTLVRWAKGPAGNSLKATEERLTSATAANRRRDALLATWMAAGFEVFVAPNPEPPESAAEDEEYKPEVKPDSTLQVGERAPTTLAAFVKRNPKWLNQHEYVTSGLRPRPGEAPELPEHPLFATWHDQVLATASLKANLIFTSDDDPQESLISVAGGEIAFLDEPQWPACETCHALLELSFQLTAHDLSLWWKGTKSLVAMFCGRCPRPKTFGTGLPGTYLKLVEPIHRLEREQSELGSDMDLLRVGVPHWSFPDSSWFNLYDGPKLSGAALKLLGGELDGRSIEEEYNAWVAPQDGGKTLFIPPRQVEWEAEARWRTFLGGWPDWDQVSGVIKCDCNTAMVHLLDFNGSQFLDGALHVFLCDHEACQRYAQPIGFVEL